MLTAAAAPRVAAGRDGGWKGRETQDGGLRWEELWLWLWQAGCGGHRRNRGGCLTPMSCDHSTSSTLTPDRWHSRSSHFSSASLWFSRPNAAVRSGKNGTFPRLTPCQGPRKSATARDYHLRMVRCHAADELSFGPGSFTGGGLNNIAVTANSVLASTFMLYAVGLGAGAIPTAGALNWVLKDGMGQLGTLVFGKTIAHNFDVHSKTWFFLSAVLLQAAAALEMLTVLVPGHFLLMGSLANMLKGLAWMAAGSTRSVFHLSFARDNNIADVTAKGTSQYIFASPGGHRRRRRHVIPLATLNATRLQMLTDAFLTSISPASAAAASVAAGGGYDALYDDSLDPRVPTPLELCAADPPLPALSRTATRLKPPIHVGSRLEHVVDGNANLLVMLLTTYKYAHFMVLPRTQPDRLHAYLQACILRRRMRAATAGRDTPLPCADEQTAELRLELQESLKAAERLTTIFMAALEANGWTISKVVVEAQRRRARW
eukprot:XP_001695583.1 predicted protein [Chlamydomonas reinhardtii]